MILSEQNLEIDCKDIYKIGFEYEFIFVDWSCRATEVDDLYEFDGWEFTAFVYNDNNEKLILEIDQNLAAWIKPDCEKEAERELSNY